RQFAARVGAALLLSCIAFGAQAATHRLTVNVNGNGSVSSSPAGINGCTSQCSADFPEGTAVQLSATPATHWQSFGWSGSTPCNSSSTTTAVAMTADITCDAGFVQGTGYIGGTINGLNGTGLVLHLSAE